MPEYRVCAQQQVVQTWMVTAADASAAAKRVKELRQDARVKDAYVEAEEHTDTEILWVEDEDGEAQEFVEEDDDDRDQNPEADDPGARGPGDPGGGMGAPGGDARAGQ